jgi:sulfate adenylyltransferase
MADLVTPHGGTLVDRIVTGDEAIRLREEAERAPAITMDEREVSDTELIATGAASPLSGFLGRADYDSVLQRNRLASGIVWTVPFSLAVTEEKAAELTVGKPAALRDANGHLWGVIDVAEIYSRDPLHEARAVYGTDDAGHPGVAYLLGRPRTLVGGSLRVLPLPKDLPQAEYRLTPATLRRRIAALGWKKVAGFHTHAPLHRADEYLTKVALEQADGLVIHPVAGDAKTDDVPAAVRFQSYEALFSRYFPKDRTILAAFPAVPRYAGPREAVFHALVRKNYGITSLCIGGDHAGVGKFYGPRDAQEIFDRFPSADLGVAPLRVEPAFFCPTCDQLASSRTCPHDQHVEPGTQVRDLLRSGGQVPEELSRPEVVQLLRAWYRKAPVAAVAPPAVAPGSSAGFILWFTGLSGAGKSTLANAVRRELEALRPVEILDGDEVRTYLSKGLGFSKEDRDTNVRRIGFVARVLARNGTPVITAAISPYRDIRAEVRELTQKEGVPFIEVYVRASIEALAARDVKGLYRKALAGEVKNFTGVSDPYEPPDNPELTVYTDRDPVQTSLQQIIDLLRARGLIPDTAAKAA